MSSVAELYCWLQQEGGPPVVAQQERWQEEVAQEEVLQQEAVQQAQELALEQAACSFSHQKVSLHKKYQMF